MSRVFQTLELREIMKGDANNSARLDTIFSAVLFNLPAPQDDVVANMLFSEKDRIKYTAIEGESEEDRKARIYAINYGLKQDVYNKAIIHFKNTFKTNIFYDEYDVFYQILTQYVNSKFTADDLRDVIENNKDEILHSKYTYTFKSIEDSLRMQKGALSDDEYLLRITNTMLSKYDVLSRTYVSWNDYLTACDTYIESYKKYFMIETVNVMGGALNGSDGVEAHLNGYKKTLRSVEDVIKYYSERQTVLSELGVSEAATGTVFDNVYLEETNTTKIQPGLLDYGVEALDKVKAKMRRGNVVCLMGPPKGGKTTFATYLAARALMQGLNVAIWPLEGTKEEWIALITSIFVLEQRKNEILKSQLELKSQNSDVAVESIDDIYKKLTARHDKEDDKQTATATPATLSTNIPPLPNHGKSSVQNTEENNTNEERKESSFIYAPNKAEILYNSLSGSQASAVAAAQTRIANQVNCGKLSFLSGIAYVENFDDILNTHYDTLNKFDVIVMDSPINMQSLQKRPKSEFLSQGFQKFKAYVAGKLPNPVLGIVTAQYKQSAIDELRSRDERGEQNKEIDVTAGGETAESIRTPDDVIGLFSNAEERADGAMRFYDIASRGNDHFEPFYIGCALGHGMFWDSPYAAERYKSRLGKKP